MTTAVAPRSARRPPGSDGSSPRRRGAASVSTRALSVWLFFALAGVFALSTGGHTYSGDEEGMLETTRSLIHARPWIDINPGNIYLDAWRPGPGGLATGVSGIGQSVIGVPFYLVGEAASVFERPAHRDVAKRLFLMFTNSFVVAGVAVLVFLLALQLGAGRRSGVALGVIYGLGTMAWAHAKTFFCEPLAAFLLALAVLLAFRAAGRAGEQAGWRLAAGAGAACAAAVFARVTMAIFLPVVGVYVVATVARRARPWAGIAAGAAFTAGAAVPLALLGLTNLWRYGSATDLGYTGFQVVHFDYPIASGLRGLLLSPGKSIFLYAPVVAVATVGLPWAIRRRPAEVGLLLALVVTNVGFFAKLNFWHGDHAWGPRYLQIVLPLMVALAAPLLDRRPWQWAAGAAGVVGFVFPGVLGVMLFFNTYFVVAANALGDKPEHGEKGYVYHMHFDPHWSPLAGHLRLLDDVARNTVNRIDGSDPSIVEYPATPDERFHWYDRPPQLDTWWAWFPAIGARRGYLLLVPLVGVGVVISWWRLGRMLVRSDC